MKNHQEESQQHKAAREKNLSSSHSLPPRTTSSREGAVEPKMEYFTAAKVTQFSKRCEEVSRPSPTPGAERTRTSAYPVHMVIEAIVQGKQSSSPVES